MKKFFLLIIVILLSAEMSYSQNPTYELIAKNFRKIDIDSITFDIYLLHTNAGQAEFKYAAGQYFFRFNPLIANGGSLSYKLIGSDLDPAFRPQNPTVSGNELRLATNLPSMTNAPIISSTAPGTLIVKMSLKTTAASFDSGQTMNLRWRNSNDPPFYTKVTCFTGMIITEITNSSSHFIDSTVIGINPLSNIIPREFKMHQNYPNPFNPSTKIRFEIPKNSEVKILVFDVRGREIEVLFNDKLNAGVYVHDWNASQYPSGIYFYKLTADGFSDVKRMVLVK